MVPGEVEFFEVKDNNLDCDQFLLFYTNSKYFSFVERFLSKSKDEDMICY